jgi:hypothetical protein
MSPRVENPTTSVSWTLHSRKRTTLKECKHGCLSTENITIKESHWCAIANDAHENVACLGCLLEELAILKSKKIWEIRGTYAMAIVVHDTADEAIRLAIRDRYKDSFWKHQSGEPDPEFEEYIESEVANYTAAEIKLPATPAVITTYYE